MTPDAPNYCIKHGGPTPGERCWRQHYGIKIAPDGRSWLRCPHWEHRRTTDVPGTPGHCHYPELFVEEKTND